MLLKTTSSMSDCTTLVLSNNNETQKAFYWCYVAEWSSDRDGLFNWCITKPL